MSRNDSGRDAVIHIGWAMEDITPEGTASLYGQYYERLSQYVQSPLTATACAIESVGAAGAREQAIMVSMDLLCPLKALQDRLKAEVAGKLPDFETRKLFIHATHTHSAPYPDVETEYGHFLLKKLVAVVVAAWKSRAPGAVSWQCGYAVTGYNRRVKYRDGTVEMYGDTSRPDFAGLEGTADPGVGMVFCWNPEQELTGIIMNVATPAQVVEAKYFVSADYWSEVRKEVSRQLDGEVFILAQCGAAGDTSPRDLARGYKAGEPNMWDIPGMVEIGKRLAKVVADAYLLAKRDIQRSVVFRHQVSDIDIPTRDVGREEYEAALLIVQEIHAREPKDPASPDTAWNRFLREIGENEKIREYGPWDNKNTDYGIVRKKEMVLEQYRDHPGNTVYTMELHVLRLGDVAIASNAFELFVDFGLSIMGRSKAKLTMIVQLSCDYNDYLATEQALAGGGYSAMANPVGPEGGWLLVDRTVDLINSMW